MARNTTSEGRTRVALAELLALRGRIGRVALPQRTSRAARAGQQASRLFGRGMDYAESRVYQAGDDVRRLDWRLTARSGRLHTKLFQEEREGRLLILLDTHSAMRFGTRVRFKSVQAARAAAWAAWYAVKAGERVGLLGFGALDELVPPRAGPRAALAICGALADWDSRPVTARTEALTTALQRAGRLLNGASRLLIISDGGCVDESARRPLVDLAHKTHVSVLAVADPLELEQAPAGRYPLEHDGARIELALHTERQQRALRDALGEGHAQLLAVCRSAGVSCRSVDTSVDPFEATALLLGLRGAPR